MKQILLLFYVFIVVTKFQIDILPNFSNYEPIFVNYNLMQPILTHYDAAYFKAY